MNGPGFGGFGGGQGFNFLFTLVPILIICVFLFVIGSAIYRGISNLNSPIIRVNSKIIGKRTDVSHSHPGGDNSMHTSSTTYYITFETEHGERIELSVSGRLYGLLAEGDAGVLIYQGTWFKDFQRELNL